MKESSKRSPGSGEDSHQKPPKKQGRTITSVPFDQLKPTFFARFRLDTGELRFAGRPATEVGVNSQGDHVIPFSLIKRGVLRHFRLNPEALGAELQNHEEDPDASDDTATAANTFAGSEGGDISARKSEGELLRDMGSMLENEFGDDQDIDKVNKERRNKVIAFIKSLSVLELNSNRLLADDLEALSTIQEECDADLVSGKSSSVVAVGSGDDGSGEEDNPASLKGEPSDAPIIEAYLKALLGEYKVKRIRKSFFKARRERLSDETYLKLMQGLQEHLIRKSIEQHLAKEKEAKQPGSKAGDTDPESRIGDSLVDDLIEVFVGDYASGNRRDDLLPLREAFKGIKKKELTLEKVMEEVELCRFDVVRQIGRSIAKGLSDNRDLVATVCERLSEGALSYYNRLPGGSYQQTKRVVSQAPPDRLSERDALDYLDDRFGDEGYDKKIISKKAGVEWHDLLTQRHLTRIEKTKPILLDTNK